MPLSQPRAPTAFTATLCTMRAPPGRLTGSDGAAPARAEMAGQ